ncbi:hypothetical protein ANTRET_LOCUS7884 [Anthophora retusa]
MQTCFSFIPFAFTFALLGQFGATTSYNGRRRRRRTFCASLDARLCISRGRRLRRKWRKIGWIEFRSAKLNSGIANDELRGEPIAVSRTDTGDDQLLGKFTPDESELSAEERCIAWRVFTRDDEIGIGTRCEVCCPLAALLNDVRHRSRGNDRVTALIRAVFSDTRRWRTNHL